MPAGIGIVFLKVVFFCVSWLDECQDAVALLALLCFHERQRVELEGQFDRTFETASGASHQIGMVPRAALPQASFVNPQPFSNIPSARGHGKHSQQRKPHYLPSSTRSRFETR